MHPNQYLINKTETLRYLAWTKELPKETAELFNQAEQLFLQAAEPRYIYQTYVKADLARLLVGEDIAEHLKKSEQVILLAATLGSKVDALIRRTQVENMALSVIIDALASAAIEEVCDKACDELEEIYAPYTLTDRYSPGYGDWPLDKQSMFAQILQSDKKIGLCVGASFMLMPIKSVTAAIGIQPKATKATKTHDCSKCTKFADCQYRKGGKTCGD